MELKRLSSVLRFWPWLAAITSGLLYTGCFAPFNFTWLCWIALTPLIAAVWFSGKDLRHRWLHNFLLGYVTGLTFFWTAFSWQSISRSGRGFAAWSNHEKSEENQAQPNGNRC
jgi:apolipoprotein N-acyltransferase